MKKKIISKLDNFWYHYKSFSPIAIVFIGMVIWIISGKISEVQPDIACDFLGQIKITDNEVALVKKDLAYAINDINNDGKKELSFFIIREWFKIELELISGNGQLFFLDTRSFMFAARQNAFEPLDALVEKYNLDVPESSGVKILAEENAEKHIFALPLKGNKLLEKIGVKNTDFFAAIRRSNDTIDKDPLLKAKTENAYRLMDELAKNNPKKIAR